MLLVHSIHACAWSMEWREVVPLFAQSFTTYSIDLLGFGASAHPPADFTSALFVDLIDDFLQQIIGKPTVLVGSSLGGTYAIAVAARRPALTRAVVAIGPAGISRLLSVGGGVGKAVQSLFRTSGVGETLFSALVSKFSIRFFLKGIYHNPGMMSDDVINLYWQSARQHNARFAPAAFVGMRLNLDIRHEYASIPTPILLVWGEFAAQTPFKEAAIARDLRADAPFVVFPSGDLPHEECPEDFAKAVHQFLGPLT